MDNTSLSYEPYNKTKLAIRGDQQYDSIIKTLGGRWNSRMKGGPGWTIDNNKEEQLKVLIANITGQNSTKDDGSDNSDEDEDDGRIVSGDNVDSPPESFEQKQQIRERPQEYRPEYRERPQEYRPEYRERPQEYRSEYRERPQEYRDRPPNRDEVYDNYRRKMIENYNMSSGVDDYYSKFGGNVRMKKNNMKKQTRREMSESESEDDYDSDELNSLVQTLNQLNEKVGKIKDKKDKSRGRKHRKRRERRDY